MSDNSECSQLTDGTKDAAQTMPGTKTCAICSRSFEPKKPNQEYCKARCRRRALLVRTKAARLSQSITVQPPIAVAVAVRKYQAARKRLGLCPAERHPFLKAHAELVEAQQQIARWEALRAQRAEHLESLAPPELKAKLIVLRPGDELTLDPAATHYASATTDSGLAVVALGYSGDFAFSGAAGLPS